MVLQDDKLVYPLRKEVKIRKTVARQNNSSNIPNMKRTTTIKRKYNGATSFCIGCDSPLKLNAIETWVSDDAYVEQKINHRVVYISQKKHVDCTKKSGLSFQMDSESPDVSSHIAEGAIVKTGSSNLGNTITNITDAVVKTADKASHVSISRPLLNNANDMTDQSIKFYLGKPVVYQSGLVSATDTSSTFTAFDVMHPLYTNAVFLNKISGVFSFRATAVFTIQFNATRFQQGRYIFYHVPTGGARSGTVMSAEWIRMHTFAKSNVTTLPHVQIDLNKDTEVSLRVPFVSWMTAMPTPNTTAVTPTIGSPGVVGLYPYMALTTGTGSTTTCDYTIWVHYENVELFSNVNTQCSDIEFQMGYADREAVSRGPVSSGLKLVSNGARLAKVPLAKLLDGIDWVADVAAGMAHSLGWSAPRIATAPVRMNQNLFVNNSNGDAARNIQLIALSANNKIDACPGFAGSEYDELTIDYLKGIYSYDETFSFETTDVTGDVLYSEVVAPQAFRRSILDGAVDTMVTTPIGLLALMFGQYRGGITYKFKFVKTEFHSGRILVAVNPIDYNRVTSGAVPSLAQTDYLHKTIIDLRECNEFEIEVPFISNTLWKSTGGAHTIANNPYYIGEIYARITVFVLNELKAPPTVSTTVSMIVEVKGSDDLEFSLPMSANLQPLIPSAISMQCNDIVFQSGEPSTGIVNSGMIGTASTSSDWLANAAAASGEVVTSLRQLLKRPGYLMNNTTGTNLYTEIVPTGWTPAVSNALTASAGTGDLTTLLSSMFCLRRGGTRLQANPDTIASLQMLTGTYVPRDVTDTRSVVRTFTAVYPFSYALRAFVNNANWVVQRLDWGFVAEIPSYATSHAQPTIAHMYDGSNAQSYQIYGSSTGSAFFFALGGGTLPTMPWYRSGADDTNYGGFAGIPVMYPSTTAFT